MKRVIYYWYSLLAITVCLVGKLSCVSLVFAETLSTAPDSPTEIFIQGASRRLTLMDLPGSATVIDGPHIRQRAAFTAVDVIEGVPGLNFAGGTARPRFFQIRGIGEFEQYEGAPNPSVGVFIDDIDLSGLGIVSSLFDIDQFEVLRGPQGTRYGASALAGSINLRSTHPGLDAAGRVEVAAGNDEFGSIAAAVGGPIDGTNGKLRLRFSTSFLTQNGFRDNAFLSDDDTNRRHERTSRLKLVSTPFEAFHLTLTYLNVGNDNGYDAFTIFNGFTTYSDRPGEDDLGLHAGSLRAEAELGQSMVLESVTSSLYSDQDYSFDGDWGNNEFWGEFAPYDFFSATNRFRHTFSQEVRLKGEPSNYVHGESYRWVTGGFFQRLHENSDISEFSDNFEYRSLQSDYLAHTGAGFTEVEAPLMTGTSLSAGFRVERRLMEYGDSNLTAFNPGQTMYGGSVSLAHDISKTLRSYFTASRGFKGGGFNAGTRVPDADRIYTPEYLWNFETGMKGDFFSGRLQSELALYYSRRKDAQLKFAFQNDPADPLAFTYVTRSLAEGYTTGVEGRVAYQATDRFQVFSNFSLMRAEYTAVPDENPNLDNREPSHAPSWMYSAGGRYDFTQRWFARVEVVGKDKFYFDDSHDAQSSSYQLLNASLGYRGDGWSWTVWGRNLLNKRYAVRGFFFGVEPPDYINKEYVHRGDPLAFGTTVSFSF